MANYNSIAQVFGEVKSPVDVDFMGKVLMAKQDQFDAGLSAVNQTFAELKQQENLLKRDEDKARFAGKIQSILNTVNASGKLDLSSKNITGSIKAQVGEALDDYTITQISNSQAIRSFEAEIAEKRKKNDGTYADQNVSYAQDNSQLKDYLAGNSDTIGNLTYENYTDYHKELKNIADNLDKYDHDIKKQFRGTGENKGYFVNREGKELTAQELKTKTEFLLSDGAKKQMQIDGYAAYDRGATEEERFTNVKNKFTEFRAVLEKEDKEKLETYKGLLNNNPTDKDYKTKVEDLTKKVATTKADFDAIEKSKVAMYTTMYTESTIRGFANAFAIDEIDETLSDDSKYWHLKDLEYKTNKDLLDAQTKTKKNQDDVQSKFTPSPLDEQGSAYDHQQETITALQATVDEKANNIYASLPQATKNSVDNLVKSSKGKMTRDGAIVSVIGKSSHLVKLADIISLDESRNALLNEKTTFNKYVNQVTEESLKSIATPQFVKRMYENPDIRVTAVGTDGKEHVYAAKDVLKAYGVSEKDGKLVGNFSNNKKLLDTFNKSILADKALSANKSDDERRDMVKRLAVYFGENEKDVISESRSSFAAGQVATSGVKNYEINPNSKTGKFLESQKKGGGYDQRWGVWGRLTADDSFDDITEADNFIKFDVKAKVNKLLNEDRTLGMNKSFMVTPGTDMFTGVARQIGDAVIPNAGNSLKISLIPGQPNMVRVSQLQKGEKGTEDTKIADVRMQDLPPEVLQKVNFQNTKQAITVANSEHIKSKVEYNDINDVNRILDLQETVLAMKPELAHLTVKENITEYLFNSSTQNIVGTEDEPTQTGNIIKKVLDDPTIQVAVVPSGTRYFVEISKQVGDKNTVIVRTSDPVDDSNIESVYKMVKYAPQTYVASILNSMLDVEKTGRKSAVLKTLTTIYGK